MLECGIDIEWEGEEIACVQLRDEGELTSSHPKVAAWLKNYLSRSHPPFPLNLDLGMLPPFTQVVLNEIAKIPFGETRSYGEVAKRVGNPKAVRAVGTACGRNPYPLLIPCHRVVAKDGIGGFSSPPEVKVKLLEFECALQ